MSTRVQSRSKSRGLSLSLARLAWLIAFLLAISLWVLGSLEVHSQPLPSCVIADCDPFALSAEDLGIIQDLGLPADLIAGFWAVTNMGIALAFFAIAVVIFWRSRDARLGMISSFTLVYLGALFFTESDDALWQARPDLGWLLAAVHALGYVTLLLFLFYFPDGTFLPRLKPWRKVILPLVLLLAPFTVSSAGGNPLATLLFIGPVGGAIAGQVYRYRRVSNPSQKQQTKWVVLGLMAALVVMLLWLFARIYLPPGQPSAQRIGFLLVSRVLLGFLIPLLPLSIAFSILRHRLFDIDLLINRALVYGALTAMVVGLYALLVGSVGLVLQTNTRLAGMLLTAVLAVVGLSPMRSVVQRAVDHLLGPHRAQLPEISMPTPAEAAAPQLAGAWLRAARAGWFVLAIAGFGVLLTAIPGYAAKFGGQLDHVRGAETPLGAHFFAAASGVASLASALLSLGMSALLYCRKFTERIAALVSFFLLIYGVLMAGPLELASARWLGSAAPAQLLQGALLATPMIALLALFPSGQFVPSWTRWIVLLSIPLTFGLLFVAPFDAEGLSQNPALFAVIAILFTALSVAGVHAQIYRYRKVSTPAERQQTRWVVFGFALWIAYIILSSIPYFHLTGLAPDAPTPWWGPASELGWWLSVSILPISLTVAVTRHRLWDVDLVINRTLVYGSLTAGVAALYVLVVGGLGLLFQSSGNLLIPLLATGLAAVFFQPLRQRLQDAVNRMMYGERDEPAALLARLGEQLERTASPEAALKGIAETVALALKLPYTAIELGEQGRPIAAYGLPGGDIESIPLVYQGEEVGQMLVAKRAAGEAFTPKDLQLLETIARQAGALAHAVRLTADLRRSRQRLVTAQEEERRRLRRDLHDGLGPVLASQGLKLAAAAQLIEEDPATARRLLESLAAQSEAMVAEIRRLVNDLRPSALDDLGLLEALSDYAAGLTSGARRPDPLRIEVRAPKGGLPALPAAVEVAAYRIATEALTNMTRHARARHGVVRLAVESSAHGRALRLEIADDGVGLRAKGKNGVGLISMRERAEELGGSLTIESTPEKGCRVLAILPLMEKA